MNKKIPEMYLNFEFWCDLDLIGKMATQVKSSPLLNLRPDFLGAGKGLEEISLIIELSKLSGLHCVQSNITFDLNTDTNQTEHVKGLPNSKMEQTRNSVSAVSDESSSSKDAFQHDKKIYKVIDCNSKGMIESEVPYTLNENTLKLFNLLEKLKITFKTEIYKPKQNRMEVDPMIFYCKNLFLKDRKGQFFLVICHEDQDINLKELRKDLLAYRNFNFANTDDMKELLNTERGGVTPLALMNNNSSNVSMVISNSLVKDGASLMFHPMDSNLATQMSLTSLLRFLKFVGHPVKFLKY